MARNPRPIDPRQGPLQAFAVELRRLRQAAGDPTYRAMSVRAGFGATTLSEAAGGVRKPSLDVTLAFIEVCGGDPVEWRERWTQLDRILTAQAVQGGPDVPSSDPVGPADDEESAALPVLMSEVRDVEVAVAVASVDVVGVGPLPQRPGAASRGGSSRAARLAVLVGAAATVLVAAVMVVPHVVESGGGGSAAVVRAASAGTAAACTSVATRDAAFSGQTYQPDTNLRAGASLDAPVVATLGAQCVLSFSGYCLGQSLRDERSGTPDMRWFKLADGSGVVASAVIHGNPPANLAPTACPQDAPPPAEVHLHVAAVAGTQDTVLLSASGVDAPIVGYAAYYSRQQGTVTEAPSWHELALDDPTYQSPPEWLLTDVRAAISGLPGAPGGTVPVVAVACLGGGAPTRVVDAAAIKPQGPASTEGVQLAAQDLASAERTACQYPTSG